MKGKYISTDILMAILAKPVVQQKNIMKEQKAQPDELRKIPAPERKQRLPELEAA